MVESDLEARVALLERRVRELEGRRPVPRATPRPAAPPAPPPLLLPEPFSPPPAPEAPPARRAAWRDAEPAEPAPARAQRRDAPQLEDLLGGRVLAWVGALAVLVPRAAIPGASQRSASAVAAAPGSSSSSPRRSRASRSS